MACRAHNRGDADGISLEGEKLFDCLDGIEMMRARIVCTSRAADPDQTPTARTPQYRRMQFNRRRYSIIQAAGIVTIILSVATVVVVLFPIGERSRPGSAETNANAPCARAALPRSPGSST